MARKLSAKFKAQFITGIVVIFPLGMTAWIVWLLFRLIGERFLPLFKNFPEVAGLPLAAQMGISAVLTLTVIWFIGLWARNFVGKIILKYMEKLVLKTPVISKIYKSIRQITETMLVNKQAFKHTAIIEYPRKGIYTLVFVTNEIKDMITVFVPSTPNPTTGFCESIDGEPRIDIDADDNQYGICVFDSVKLFCDNNPDSVYCR